MQIKIKIILTIAISLILYSSFVYSAGFESQEWDMLTSALPFFNNYYSKDSYTKLFYPVKGWEVEVCSRGITSELTDTTAVNGNVGTSTDLSKIYDITASISALKYNYLLDNRTLYEITWYIQPMKNEISYKINLIGSNNNKIEVKSGIADPAQGDAGYIAEYYDKDYTFVSIIVDNQKLIQSAIIDNPYSAEYE